jgi:Holliday junction resolvase RusA-like endonuclease
MMIIKLKGQTRGGKNSIMTTRTGRRYPNPIFSKWVLEQLSSIKKQLGTITPINEFTYYWEFHYTPEDKRRRDVPAILDGVFHLLEKAGVVSDDRYITNIRFVPFPASKDRAGMVIHIDKTEPKGEYDW